jgi:hypothetical protein
MSESSVPRVDVCPACDSPKITARKTKTPEYRCNVCTERFAEPDQRVSKNHAHKTATDGGRDDGRYAQLVAALKATREAGSTFARSKLIADYSDALSTQEVATLCARRAEPRGDVARYREASLGIVWRITVDESEGAA